MANPAWTVPTEAERREIEQLRTLQSQINAAELALLKARNKVRKLRCRMMILTLPQH